MSKCAKHDVEHEKQDVGRGKWIPLCPKCEEERQKMLSHIPFASIISCRCGFVTGTDNTMTAIGEEFDAHIADVRSGDWEDEDETDGK